MKLRKSGFAQKKRLLTEIAATLHNVNHDHTYACANQEGTEEVAIGNLKSELPISQAVHLLYECEVVLNIKARTANSKPGNIKIVAQ